MQDTVVWFIGFLILWGGTIYAICQDDTNKKRIRKIVKRKKDRRSERQKGGY